MLRIVAIAVMFGLIIAAPGYCQEIGEEKVVKAISGRVTDIDWVNSSLTLEGYEDVTITFPPGFEITHQTDKISFGDIEIDDYLSVKYYVDSSGNAVAEHAVLEKSYPSF